MRTQALALIAAVTLTFVPAHAEIEKIAEPCEEGICFRWWPKLAPVAGWHQDSEASHHYAFNAQAPDGETFYDAESVIYAKAGYKPRMPETKSLETLIENDKKEFLSNDPSMVVAEVDPLKTGDGKPLRCFTFFPKKEGNWEEVAFGEEGDFYLTFVVSSRTKESFAKTLDAFKKFIGQYKEKP